MAVSTPLLGFRIFLGPLQNLANASPSPIIAASWQPPSIIMTSDPISVLFVCLGNICRSTMAEGIFRSIVSKPLYQSLVKEVDSCGTGAYHTGSSPDSRTMSTLEDNGITDYNHAARKVSGSICMEDRVSHLLPRSISPTSKSSTTSLLWTGTTFGIFKESTNELAARQRSCCSESMLERRWLKKSMILTMEGEMASRLLMSRTCVFQATF